MSLAQGISIMCGSSTMRLVSSGDTHNAVTVFVKAVEEADLDMDKNLLLMCPDFF